MSVLGSQHCALILLPPDKFSATNWTITFTLVLRFYPLFEIGPLSVTYVRKKVKKACPLRNHVMTSHTASVSHRPHSHLEAQSQMLAQLLQPPRPPACGHCGALCHTCTSQRTDPASLSFPLNDSHCLASASCQDQCKGTGQSAPQVLQMTR